MPLAQRAAGRRELTGWEAVWMPLGEGEAERLTIGIGSGWKPIEVPRQLAAHEGRQSVWYRTEFPRPDHAGRVVLRIGGAFLATNVWLNGRLLGSHYGYFAPFGFDLTPYLKAENLLVICCESPVEPEPEKKRHIMGLFNDGDLKPYPASAYSSLPDSFRLEVPVGLWRPVELEYVGPIAVIDSGEHRSLAATPYNQRRREAESGHPKRRRHVDSEIARVREFVDALHDRDFPRMGELLKESHASLRDDFEVSTQVVDTLVERAWSIEGCLGARIMGAGFGGSILALVQRGREVAFAAAMKREVIFCATADGAFVHRHRAPQD